MRIELCAEKCVEVRNIISTKSEQKMNKTEKIRKNMSRKVRFTIIVFEKSA